MLVSLNRKEFVKFERFGHILLTLIKLGNQEADEYDDDAQEEVAEVLELSQLLLEDDAELQKGNVKDRSLPAARNLLPFRILL